MRFFEEKDGGIVFRENGEMVRIIPWGEDSVRVESAYLGEIPDSNAALLPQEECKAQIQIGDMDSCLTNGKITVKLHVEGWGKALCISFYNEKGEPLISEIPNGGALQKRARYFRPLSGGEFYLKASFVGNEDEKIYGMGQYQQEIFDLKGCNLELAHRNSQASVPFYLSSAGYGFMWNNPAIGAVHFGKNTTEWEANVTNKLDYWITAGDTPKEIMEHFGKAVGTVPMMPEYGLGFWQCKLRYYNQKQVLSIAEEYRKRDIPVDVLVIDYYHWPRCGDWRFDPEYFEDPKTMVQKLHDMGIETMVSIWPQVDWRSENYEEMRQQGLLVRNNGGIDAQMIFHGNNVFMDATNPRTRAYVWDKIKKNYADLGIRTFWLDEAEPEFGTYDFEQYRYYAGSVSEIGNIYPREYARLFYEGQRANGQEDIVNLIRCAWLGSQRYGALVWSGDIMSTYEDFRKQICAGLHMGIAGIPWWTTDIGGFHAGDVRSEDFKELLIRWFQFGTFCPVMRIHGCRQPVEQIVNAAGEIREQTGADNEIWSYGEENERIMTKFIRIRLSMKEYIRSIMEEAHKNAAPVMRPMFFEFPEDERTYDIWDSYMFGGDILVAPVCYEHEMKRSVYLPKGATWTLANDGSVYEGGQTIEVEAGIETLPIFLRNKAQEYLIGKL